MSKLPVAMLLSALLAACGSNPPVTNSATSTSIPPATPPRAQPAVVRPTPAQAKPTVSELNDPTSPLAKRTIYFPYDEFIVDPKYDQLLSAHASYLARNPTARIALEGNADERGSTEYNLALGQKRAEAVRKVLMIRGAPDKQMEAISYGEEKPKATCHEERCWQENRRTDIVYPAAH